MSVSAALASNLLANGLPLRFCQLSIHGNRLKPEFFPNSMFSVAQVVHPQQQLVLLQKSPVPSTTSRWCCVKAFASSGAEMGMSRRDGQDQLGFDALLSMVEVLCIVPSAVFAVGGIVGTFLPGMPKLLQVNSGNVFLVWQFFLLMGAVVVGGLIRQRQWQRISRDNREVGGCDLIKRIEKVEEDLRSSVKIVRVLSRQLEKLGIRFRVTRKALKEPIAETAVLAQKNSEATHALALQEDILEKELGEIQKVLLAMQEQQQKQLELILAVAKAGRLFENKQDPATDGAAGKINSVSTTKRVGTNGNQNPTIRSHQ